MGHRCEYTDRVSIEYDYELQKRYLVRSVTASYKDKSLEVYKELEPTSWYGSDRYFSRNLEYSNMAGYLVTFPGEKPSHRYYYGGLRKEATLDDWQNTSKCNLWCSNTASYSDEANIIELYPKFKYVLAKMPESDKRIERVLEILEVWKEHPEVEGLCAIGFYDVALNKTLFKLTLAKRKQIIKWLSQNKDLVLYPQWMKLRHIQSMIKHKLTIEQFEDYQRHTPTITKWVRFTRTKWTADIKTFFYLKKHGYSDERSRQVVELYYDYITMAKRVGHDMNDSYWLYPSDIGKAHAKVMEELKNIQTTASALQGNYLKAVMQPLADKFNAKVDGYDIFLPTDIETVKKQCDVLYQCLLRNNYVNNVLMQEEILVFIWKDGVPQATAQVFYDKKLGQFYGDERGHSRGESCAPSAEVQKAFEKWLLTFEPYKVKAEREKTNKHYYKGFHSVDKNGVYHTSFGNFSFEVGKTYATDFLDNEIVEAGGEKCVATNKVFHFCENIEEISRHYNPTCYAEVEPLGPVVECDGAFLSNRIKIVRALSDRDVELLKGIL